MASRNQFDLLGDVDNDDPTHLLAAAEKKAAAAPKPAPAPAKLPTKPPPPTQAVREARNYGAPPRDGAGRGGPGRGRGGRGFRTGPRRDFGDADANGFEGRYGGGFGDGGVARSENGEGRQAERGHGPWQAYRGGGRRGGYADGQAGDEFGRPRRAHEHHSGTGRGYEMKHEGAGRGNWGAVTDEGLAQLRWFIESVILDTVEAVNVEETAAVVEDEKKPEDAPQSEVEKGKEGVENEEEEKEPEDKGYGSTLSEHTKHHLFHDFGYHGIIKCSAAWFHFGIFVFPVKQSWIFSYGCHFIIKIWSEITFAPTIMQEMTLEEYEKVLEEKRKALLALKAEERKVEIDKELQSMQQLSVKKDADEVFIKLGSDKDLKKKENAERDERAKKSLSINEFLKPAEGERYCNPSGRGHGRGRGRGERGGFQGGYNSGYRGPAAAAAPAIEDQAQFPALA
ncbi:hypothetical protein BAE44_0011731 [Dichanthelium oligosanthes]|uniref:Hyaluronan/mRNA-binding protein domain-containing protein n=1 Tax=Dichanthelium oligosanthes TaxID=888268 RepID=A0A1E5VQ89_9POAL|nr:hypothetical protein BAE44_0011731 [Dichanthelium oligosanthes]